MECWMSDSNANGGKAGDPIHQIIACDPNSEALLRLAHKAAKAQAAVMITGETGVGKEVIAKYIHTHSNCHQGPFVAVNCAAMPDNMIEAILFGYEKGAFTNAVSAHAGKFEQAQNGTLLLDEISEIPLHLQAKLLRVLQEQEVERIGAKKTQRVNARIIATTNRDLPEYIQKGHFRSDLYYRLNVITLHCASLADRPLDILPLAEYFLKYYANAFGKETVFLTEEAKRKLLNYNWPGNVRELENIMQRSLLLSEQNEITVTDIDLPMPSATIVELKNVNEEDNYFTSPLKANEAQIIMEVLKTTAGCRHQAAQKLNMSPRTLRYKIARLRSIGFKVP
jgi:two-component system response regulator FlrC